RPPRCGSACRRSSRRTRPGPATGLATRALPRSRTAGGSSIDCSLPSGLRCVASWIATLRRLRESRACSFKCSLMIIAARESRRPGPCPGSGPSRRCRNRSPRWSCNRPSCGFARELAHLRLLEVPEEIRVGTQHQRAVLADGPVALQGAEKGIELRVGAEGLAVYARGLGIGVTAAFFRLASGIGTDLLELALHVAEALLAATTALGTGTCGEGLAFGDPALSHLLANGVDVVDPLDAHVA